MLITKAVVPPARFLCGIYGDWISSTRILGVLGFFKLCGLIDCWPIRSTVIGRVSRSRGPSASNVTTSSYRLTYVIRLLGFCVDGEDKILGYEFMPNGSLDAVLYGTFIPSPSF